ncbi:rho GTPase-activating protein 26-like [Sarcoramphus papa]
MHQLPQKALEAAPTAGGLLRLSCIPLGYRGCPHPDGGGRTSTLTLAAEHHTVAGSLPRRGIGGGEWDGPWQHLRLVSVLPDLLGHDAPRKSSPQTSQDVRRVGMLPSKGLLRPQLDFLRSIPAKLLVSHLYEDWMQAMERTSKQAKVEELKAVAEKLPAANLLLLQRLLSLLQRIGHNASTSRMTSSNLAVCLGPNLLSPPNEDQLPLQAMLEVTAKVNVLVEFMIENRGDVFGEETPGLSCPSAQESPAPMAGSTDLRLEEQSGPAGRADKDHQATACLDASPSLLDLLKEAGGDTLLQSETAEAPRALPPTTPESAAEALVRPEQRTSLSEERR